VVTDERKYLDSDSCGTFRDKWHYNEAHGRYEGNTVLSIDVSDTVASIASGKMVFALDIFTGINVTLWTYERITSISDTLYCYILGGDNLNVINAINTALYYYILAISNTEHQ